MAQPGRAERLRLARERNGDTCIWCGIPFSDRTAATTDHVIPRVKGGPSWASNEVAACRRCNGERGHRAAVDWLEECERRGWRSDEGRLRRTIDALADEIRERGGQRRARPQLEAQLRRLRRRGTSAA